MKRWSRLGPSLGLGLGLLGCVLACGEPEDEVPAGSTSEATASDSDTGSEVECTVVDALGPGDHERTIEHDGVMRSYILHVAEEHDAQVAAPLVLNMHGFLSSAQMQVQWSQLNATAGPRGWLVAHPTGTDNSWNGGSCCGEAASSGRDDVAFLSAVVDDIGTLVCIDPRRVHATGMSNGGYMSHRLACDASDVFASVAPVAAALGVPDCNPPRPISVLAFNGVQDTLVAHDDAVTSMQTWAELDGCEATPAKDDFEGGHLHTYEGCDGGSSVKLYTLDPMGHCWPGGDESQCFGFLGPHSDAIDANTVMLDFFDAHRLPAAR
jgi:polyhydroxybutyrate depolymerase